MKTIGKMAYQEAEEDTMEGMQALPVSELPSRRLFEPAMNQ